MIPKPVFQDRTGYGQGNCVWACVATIFGLPFEEVSHLPPPSVTELLDWTKEAMPDWEFHNQDFCTNYRIEWGFPDVEGVGTGRWTYDLPKKWTAPREATYWMASIHSPGLVHPVESSWYGNPGLHAVVMRRRKLYHDPNPKYKGLWTDENQPLVLQRSWWTPK